MILAPLVCFANKNKNCQLSYSWFQTSQTGGQQYSDTSPLVFPGCSDTMVGHLPHQPGVEGSSLTPTGRQKVQKQVLYQTFYCRVHF